jgi:hypothetical protein
MSIFIDKNSMESQHEDESNKNKGFKPKGLENFKKIVTDTKSKFAISSPVQSNRTNSDTHGIKTPESVGKAIEHFKKAAETTRSRLSNISINRQTDVEVEDHNDVDGFERRKSASSEDSHEIERIKGLKMNSHGLTENITKVKERITVIRKSAIEHFHVSQTHETPLDETNINQSAEQQSGSIDLLGINDVEGTTKESSSLGDDDPFENPSRSLHFRRHSDFLEMEKDPSESSKTAARSSIEPDKFHVHDDAEEFPTFSEKSDNSIESHLAKLRLSMNYFFIH